MPEIFTIGYEGADLERFLLALRDAGIEDVADVRAVALSRKRGFSKNALKGALAEAGLGYLHLQVLGTPAAGRAAARAGDAGTMHRIYCDEVLANPGAGAAVDSLAELARDRRVCLLCFERDPANCHRRILSDRLASKGFTVTDLFAPQA